MNSLQDTLNTNKKQAAYYDSNSPSKRNFATKIWRYLRERTLKELKKELDLGKICYDHHFSCFGDLSTKKVLDLGCGKGNYFSVYLAENSRRYIAIDLSKNQIKILSKKISHLKNADAITMDLFSKDFNDKDFDLIYAYGVLHHFKDFDLLLNKLNDILSPNGEIVCLDPLETSFPIWLLRKIYRPFQSDSNWEWPFTRKKINKIHNKFNVLSRKGILGKSKWYFLISILPISKNMRLSIGKKLHSYDWDNSSTSDASLYSCMQLSMHLQKK